MLTDEEKQRIQLEEKYRSEVRSQLEPQERAKPFRSRFWIFLNSSLGLWLLSALFLSGAGALFTKYQEARSDLIKKRELVERLDLEISYRYSQILIRMFKLTNGNFNDIGLAEGKTAQDVQQIMDSLNQAPSQTLGALYPEFAALSLSALKAELRRHVDDDAQRREIDLALQNLTGQAWSSTSHYGDVKVMGKFIHLKLLLPRWKKSSFYMINCPVEKPFC